MKKTTRMKQNTSIDEQIELRDDKYRVSKDTVYKQYEENADPTSDIRIIYLLKWKQCPYPYDDYEACTYNGQIRSMGYRKTPSQRIEQDGYKIVSLFKLINEKKERFDRRVHTILALTFFGEPPHSNYTVDHIDQNKINNNLYNLRYISGTEQNYNRPPINIDRTGCSKHMIEQLDLRGVKLAEFKNLRDAEAKLNIFSQHISSVCTGRLGSVGGFIFRYKKMKYIKGEQWIKYKFITKNGKGIEDVVEVSTEGRIKYKGRSHPISHNKGKEHKCGRVNLSGTNFTLGKLILLAFIGPPPEPKSESLHFDCNNNNNSVSNLKWASHSEITKYNIDYANGVYNVKKRESDRDSNNESESESDN